ncbi:MAG: hypothetical protein Q9217_004097, partial [Psora testacea]
MSAGDHEMVDEFVIHPSCNSTETIQLRKGLADAVTLAQHAKQHILRYGNSSDHYRKYFGKAPSGEAIGYYEKVVNGNKAHALFRCDNPDGNCDLPDYGGHWRGENATNETVICPLSYETRRPLEQMCAFGYTVAENETNTYFGSDLLHRLYHIPTFGEGHVEHFTEDFAGALEQAKHNATYATHDSDVLQYFALETYAYEVAVPGVGCPGALPESDSVTETHSSSAVATETHSSSAVATETHSSSAVAMETHNPPAVVTTAPSQGHPDDQVDSPTPTVTDSASAVIDVPP